MSIASRSEHPLRTNIDVWFAFINYLRPLNITQFTICSVVELSVKSSDWFYSRKFIFTNMACVVSLWIKLGCLTSIVIEQ